MSFATLKLQHVTWLQCIVVNWGFCQWTHGHLCLFYDVESKNNLMFTAVLDTWCIWTYLLMPVLCHLNGKIQLQTTFCRQKCRIYCKHLFLRSKESCLPLMPHCYAWEAPVNLNGNRCFSKHWAGLPGSGVGNLVGFVCIKYQCNKFSRVHQLFSPVSCVFKMHLWRVVVMVVMMVVLMVVMVLMSLGWRCQGPT